MPSFAPDAGEDDHILVLWRWDKPQHKVAVVLVGADRQRAEIAKLSLLSGCIEIFHNIHYANDGWPAGQACPCGPIRPSAPSGDGRQKLLRPGFSTWRARPSRMVSAVWMGSRPSRRRALMPRRASVPPSRNCDIAMPASAEDCDWKALASHPVRRLRSAPCVTQKSPRPRRSTEPHLFGRLPQLDRISLRIVDAAEAADL